MSKLLEQIKHTVDATIPDREELPHKIHPKLDYALLVSRNLFVLFAVILFLSAMVFRDAYSVLKAVAYFFGAGAYVFECLAATDCFQTKVPHTEMFMIYCFGPLYILMGFSYLFLH
ncbi:MAG: hypothetical protein IKC69_05635 [Clostridia bacterium]|nr:hypothetical protein [Clostridia bacterium]